MGGGEFGVRQAGAFADPPHVDVLLRNLNVVFGCVRGGASKERANIQLQKPRDAILDLARRHGNP